MQIKFGGKYVTRVGAVVTIVDQDHSDEVYPYQGDNEIWYTGQGLEFNGTSPSEVDLMHEAVAEMSVPGRKDDSQKLDLTLLFDDCPHALEAIAEVLQWAVTKKQPKPYDRGSWQGVTDFFRRYRAAAYRHQLGAAKGALLKKDAIHFQRDEETGLLELAHIATDAIFQLEKAVRAQKGIE